MIMYEGWWIDFMEDEMANSPREEMDLLIKYSETDQVILENYRNLRRALLQSDPANEFEGFLNEPTYQRKLHGKIMAKIEEAQENTASEFEDPEAQSSLWQLCVRGLRRLLPRENLRL